jgi:hypothetical protein
MMGPILEAGLSLEGQLGPGTDLWRSIRFGASLSRAYDCGAAADPRNAVGRASRCRQWIDSRSLGVKSSFDC